MRIGLQSMKVKNFRMKNKNGVINKSFNENYVKKDEFGWKKKKDVLLIMEKDNK